MPGQAHFDHVSALLLYNRVEPFKAHERVKCCSVKRWLRILQSVSKTEADSYGRFNLVSKKVGQVPS